MTTSFAHVHRGSMHVVEHNYDLFSWKKYNNYMHMLTLYEYRCKGIIECGSKLLVQSTKFSLYWLLTLQRHVLNEKDVL